MEITELNLRFRKSINNFIELGEVPILSFNSGFMDSFLDSYHDTFGFPDYLNGQAAGLSSERINSIKISLSFSGISVNSIPML